MYIFDVILGIFLGMIAMESLIQKIS